MTVHDHSHHHRGTPSQGGLGFLVQWPTLLTLAMFPVLVWVYIRLARSEVREVAGEFGDAYRQYAARVPRFIPRIPMTSAGASEA